MPATAYSSFESECADPKISSEGCFLWVMTES